MLSDMRRTAVLMVPAATSSASARLGKKSASLSLYWLYVGAHLGARALHAVEHHRLDAVELALEPGLGDGHRGHALLHVAGIAVPKAVAMRAMPRMAPIWRTMESVPRPPTFSTGTSRAARGRHGRAYADAEEDRGQDEGAQGRGGREPHDEEAGEGHEESILSRITRGAVRMESMPRAETAMTAMAMGIIASPALKGQGRGQLLRKKGMREEREGAHHRELEDGGHDGAARGNSCP